MKNIKDFLFEAQAKYKNGFYRCVSNVDGFAAYIDGKTYSIAPFGLSNGEDKIKNLNDLHCQDEIDSTDDIADYLDEFIGMTISGKELVNQEGFENWPSNRDLKFSEIKFE